MCTGMLPSDIFANNSLLRQLNVCSTIRVSAHGFTEFRCKSVACHLFLSLRGTYEVPSLNYLQLTH